jgi:glycosyltransferase involved in cell wall biosynthesis
LTAARGEGAPSVLVWDVVSNGHHRRYLETIVATAPAGYTLTLPHWTPPEIAAAAGPNARLLPEPESDDEWRSFKRAVTLTRPDGVLLLEAHRLVRWLTFRSRPDLGKAVVAVDMLVRDGIFANPRAYVHGLRLRSFGAACASWLAHEVVVRRLPVRFLRLNGWADRIGTRRLRSRTVRLPDPLEHLPPAPARPKRRPTQIALLGLLKERKGLDLLVVALERLAREGRIQPADIEVAIAGPCDVGYEEQLEQLVARLHDSGFGTHIEIGVVPPRQLSAVLAATDVLVLPYHSHFGGSGFLGTAFDFPDLTVVCSDFGWLGHIAGSAGSVLFRNGDAGDLANALEQALSERPRLDPARREGYAEPDSFGRLIWSLLPLAS